MPPLKRCSSCKEEKPTKDFNRSSRKPDGLQNQCRSCNNSGAKRWHTDNLERQMLSAARYRSKRKGIPFNIELEDIVVPERCPVLHIFLDRTPGSPADSTPHLDKIVPERGYVRGNVRVISGRANRLKSDGKLHELRALVAYMENSIEA